MASILSKINIINGEQVNHQQITQSIDAFTGDVEYDITVSGSFTLTGSLNVDGTIFGETTESASIAITSSYSDYSENTISASLALYNSGSLYTLQLYAPSVSTLSPSTIYNIGVGETMIVDGLCGVTIPIDSIIVNSSIVSSCEGIESGASASMDLIKGNSFLLANLGSVDYGTSYSYQITNHSSITVVQGDRIWVKLTTNSTTPQPTDISHNITLTLQPI